MGIYSSILRIFIAISVILSVYTGDIEYSTALSVLSGVYIFAYFLIPKNPSSKRLFFIFDIFFISISIYLTGYTYLSLLIIPIFAEFVKDTKEIVYFSTLSLIPVFTSLYISNFTELSFIPIIFAGTTGILGLYRTFSDRENYFRELKNEMENLYIKNISYQEMINQQSKILKVYSSLKQMREKKFPLKIWIYDINETLGTDGIMFFDIKNNRCYSTEKINCDKSILNYIDKPVIFFKNHEVNKKLNAPHVVAITVEDKTDVYGIVIIVSKLKEIDKETVEIIRDNLVLYINELSENTNKDMD
ncbi:hypothetical protein SAMN06265182_1994 [Persephonella hydrogeniphila]|uniref:Uncharacterized protein n=1 Tax=Persephonella hydrogeniphila TaxID=198703 RepID=A0A285NQ40_9AQUI|nr:hypothetical protein [Persephonella hydrogeniphila]SNZ11053.1 hypothetical protein SAMN06265182_1994 [Persephonella hydrogeniphila]